jgi:hypothetical protein
MPRGPRAPFALGRPRTIICISRSATTGISSNPVYLLPASALSPTRLLASARTGPVNSSDDHNAE